MKKFIVIVALLLFLTGCDFSTGNVVINDNLKQFTNETLPLKVAKLEPINLNSVETFDTYKSFVDDINNLIKILNEQNDLFHIEPFNPSRMGWEKASRLITEYSPLINNYNEVVLSAKAFKENPSEDSKRQFYLASGKFAFETSLIAGAVFYTASYETVGIAYRAIGLNKFAFKCPSCVSIILSQAHWTIRTVLVEGASQGAEISLEKIIKMQEDGTLNQIKEKANNKLNKSLNSWSIFLNKVTR